MTERISNAAGALLAWEMHFRLRFWRGEREHLIRGVSHLKFDDHGKVAYHRDYWDAAEELYEKVPLLGCIMRRLKNAMAA